MTLMMKKRERYDSVRRVFAQGSTEALWGGIDTSVFSSLFNKHGRTVRLATSVCVLLADVAAFALAAAVGSMAVHSATSLERVDVLVAGSMAGFVCAMLYLLGRAHYQRRLPLWSELRQVVDATLVALAVTGFIGFWTGRGMPRIPLVVLWVAFPVLAMALRSVTRYALDAAGMWRLRVVVVGQGETSRQALEALRSEPRLGYDVVEVVGAGLLESFSGGRRPRILTHFNADMLILAMDPEDRPDRAMIESLVRARVPFAVMPRMDGLPVMGCEQTAFFSHDTVMLTYRNNLAKPVARMAKVAFDVALASAALLILSPLFLLIAAAIRSDGGPVLFAHRRIGADGRSFQCLKFRSMVVDSDRVLRDMLERDPVAAREWGETQKLRDDPRITWIGNMLRKTSLDELPQLLNVLRLEMSLVGPRPIVASEVSKYADDIAFYHETRPGLTGLWQVSGRSGTSYARRVELDSWYVKNWTIWHDLAIIAKTVPAVLKRKGAI